MHISDYRQFSDIHISQGSVATYFNISDVVGYLNTTLLQIYH